MSKFYLLLVILLVTFVTNEKSSNISFDPDKLNDSKLWHQADSVMQTLTIDEQIGQLIMIGTHANTNQKLFEKTKYYIDSFKIGGIIFFKGHPTKQYYQTNFFQKESKTPLFIAIDGEWGVSMRLDSVINFPRQMTLGAISDNSLIYQMGKQIAEQCHLLGININFAPVIDINNNPNNPVIHTRSFGENKTNVAQKGYAYMKGLQGNSVMAVAKHFPGHGDTDVDSHKDLPEISHDTIRQNEIELYPFRYLINRGVQGVMVAHLSIPAYDSTKHLPATLSPKVINQKLIRDMGFKGLVITDALQMKGLTKYFEPGEAAVRALLAGNDILLMPESVEKAVEGIKQAIKSNRISTDIIRKKVQKIIYYKIKLGLYEQDSINSRPGLISELQNPKFELLKRKLIQKSITLLRNKDSIIPIINLDSNKIACVSVGVTSENPFQNRLSSYANVDFYQLKNSSYSSEIQNLYKNLNAYSTVIIGLQNVSKYNLKTFGLGSFSRSFVDSISKRKNVILVNFGTPYILKYFQNARNVLQVYENDALFQDIAAQSIFGASVIEGRLPVSVGTYKVGQGIDQNQKIRLSYSIPESQNFSSNRFFKIDSIVEAAINQEAMPGCQVLVAKNNTIIFQKSYGYHTYDKLLAVSNSDIYDLASITKVVATLPLLMKMYAQKPFSFTDSLASFIYDSLPEHYQNTQIGDILMHQAGFEAWIPFYTKFMTNHKPEGSYFSYSTDSLYPIPVCNNLYTLASTKDSIWKIILSTPVNEKKEYVYSDLDFMFLQKVDEQFNKTRLDSAAQMQFYSPLGMHNTCFNAYKKHLMPKIIPTEDDKYFRMTTVQGYVHDPAAALMDGVAGHAGLFSNSNDLAIYMQMLLNGGRYGGKQYLDSKTIDTFSQTRSKISRRAYGFDKPETDKTESYSPTSWNTSEEAFGHTGFTGTCVWADPKTNLIYIFLSNRTYPNSDNRKLIRFKTRALIQEELYNMLSEDSAD